MITQLNFFRYFLTSSVLLYNQYPHNTSLGIAPVGTVYDTVFYKDLNVQ